jgi:hypothetical protein
MPSRTRRDPGPYIPSEVSFVLEMLDDTLEVRRRENQAELAGVTRCPRCGGVLVARVGRRGPYFHCRCREGPGPGAGAGGPG